jgi:hypothetical protein
MNTAVPTAILLCASSIVLHAQLLPEAASSFPAPTTSLEYDALSKLRLLPSYRSLRKQYSGEGLQRAQKALSLLGVSEDQLSEVLTASGPNGFFGLLAGNFRSDAMTREAAKHGIVQIALEDGAAFCSKDGICFLPLTQEEGHAFFGTIEQLRAVSDVRQGRAPSLETNATFMDLKTRVDQQSPVFGFAPGREIGDWIGSSIPQSIASRLDLTRLFSGIQSFGYSVKLDNKAHVALSLICNSEEAGTLLKDALSAASGLERAAAMAAGSSALPFDNMAVRSSGRLVDVSLDAPAQ